MARCLRTEEVHCKAPITQNAFFKFENAMRTALPFLVTFKKEQCAAFFYVARQPPKQLSCQSNHRIIASGVL